MPFKFSYILISHEPFRLYLLTPELKNQLSSLNVLNKMLNLHLYLMQCHISI